MFSLHHLDNAIMEKKDLRFQTQDQAETYAQAQYQAYCNAQAVYLLPSGLYAVQELEDSKAHILPFIRGACAEMAELMGGKEVYYIDSMPGEG